MASVITHPQIRRSRGGNNGLAGYWMKAVGILILVALFIVRNQLADSMEGVWTTESGSSSTNANTVASSFDPNDPDFELAKRESLGFFDDVSSHHWDILKRKVQEMSPNYNDWYLPHPGQAAPGDKRNSKSGFFYQNHYEPDFVCQHERRIGVSFASCRRL